MTDTNSMPSESITPGNFFVRTKECQRYLADCRWEHFDFLYSRLSAFVDHEDDVIQSEDSWRQFQDSVKRTVIQRLESAESFDDYQIGIRRLAMVVKDPKTLWTVMHTQINAKIKVTLNQSQILAITFFTPIQLFEFGFPAFSASPICETTNINKDEALVDVFYAVACSVSSSDCGAVQLFMSGRKSCNSAMTILIELALLCDLGFQVGISKPPCAFRRYSVSFFCGFLANNGISVEER
jgi:hypothetical protein